MFEYVNVIAMSLPKVPTPIIIGVVSVILLLHVIDLKNRDKK